MRPFSLSQFPDNYTTQTCLCPIKSNKIKRFPKLGHYRSELIKLIIFRMNENFWPHMCASIRSLPSDFKKLFFDPKQRWIDIVSSLSCRTMATYQPIRLQQLYRGRWMARTHKHTHTVDCQDCIGHTPLQLIHLDKSVNIGR